MEVLKTQGDRFKSANLAIGKSQRVLQNMNDIMFTPLANEAKAISGPGPINQTWFGFVKSRAGETLMAQQDFEIQVSQY